MAELEIKATITRMAKFERESGASITDAINSPSLDLLVGLTRSLSGATDDQIDEYVAENGMDALSNKLLEAFVDSGFLPKAQVEQLIGEAEASATSQNSGKA